MLPWWITPSILSDKCPLDYVKAAPYCLWKTRIRTTWLLHKTEQLSVERHTRTEAQVQQSRPWKSSPGPTPATASADSEPDLRQVGAVPHSAWSWVPGWFLTQTRLPARATTGPAGRARVPGALPGRETPHSSRTTAHLPLPHTCPCPLPSAASKLVTEPEPWRVW